MRSALIFRTRMILGILLLIGVALLVRLYFVQVVHGAEYEKAGARQYVTSLGVLFNRGSIYFQDKGGQLVSAASVRHGHRVAIRPADITDIEGAHEMLSEVADIEFERFEHRASKTDDPYEEIARKLGEEEVVALTALDLPGVIVSPDQWRFYPGGDLASHAVGFTAFKGDELAGRYGVERFYDDVLSRTQSSVHVNFFAELFAGAAESLDDDKMREGDVVLTIEPSVQRYLEEVLLRTNRKWSSKRTAGIVIEPSTGAIRAIGAVPSFDPNNFGDVESVSAYSNPLIENVYEMGSIVKPLTMTAGLDAGAVTPDTTYYDAGSLTLNEATIRNYDNRGRGTVNMQAVLSQSLNTGVAFIVEEMGKGPFAEYMLERFRMGQKSGIDLPNEGSPLVANLETNRDLEYATASFGQGIALSPIAITRALSIMANGGYTITPHIVSAIRHTNGDRTELAQNMSNEQVLTPDTSRIVSSMLVEVVDEALDGGNRELEHHTVAAKTGTAQIASPDGGYYEDRMLHTFFGYFPAYQPRFLVFIMTEEPNGARYASNSLTDPFFEMTEY